MNKLRTHSGPLLIWLMAVFACGTVTAHDAEPDREAVSADEAIIKLGIDPDQPVRVQEIDQGFYVLFGLGGNVLVSSGKDGVLVIDDQFPHMVPKLKAAMAERGDGKVDFAVNTHWHFDHAGGNEVLAADGTWLVSQANSRKKLQANQRINLGSMTVLQPAYPEQALPDITFNDTMQFHFNGERIELWNFGPAHTTGDATVYFSGHNAVHLGDVFNLAGYPFVDAGNGGTLDGFLATCEAVLGRIGENAIVIPGHGPVSDRAGLEAYTAMLRHVYEEMSQMIVAGNSLDEIKAAGITRQWDEVKGDPSSFLERSYASLTHQHLDH
ncbi:MAG TPA: MBL fold metallo-hydrolase [Xanthomonadales bacterium]|nr:MBL fold metallo-hydrolase [Xanthomonadales bacterium]